MCLCLRVVIDNGGHSSVVEYLNWRAFRICSSHLSSESTIFILTVSITVISRSGYVFANLGGGGGCYLPRPGMKTLKKRQIHASGTGSTGMAPRIMDPFSTNDESNFGLVSTWNKEQIIKLEQCILGSVIYKLEHVL